MDIDLIFILGLIIGAFSIPALVSAFADRRVPKMPAISIMISAAMLTYAIQQKPDAYRFDRLDDVFVAVVARYLG